jgi:hypothetical protein
MPREHDEAGHLLGEYSTICIRQQEHIWLGDLPVAVIGGGGGVYPVLADHLNTPRQIIDTTTAYAGTETLAIRSVPTHLTATLRGWVASGTICASPANTPTARAACFITSTAATTPTGAGTRRATRLAWRAG